MRSMVLIESRTSDIVSSVIELMTILALGFLDNTSDIISFRLPDDPPMKTWVGAGRDIMASGAVPCIISKLEALNFILFC